MMKNALSDGQTLKHPSFFLSGVASQILDRVALSFPVFQQLLVPLKHIIFQAIFRRL